MIHAHYELQEDYMIRIMRDQIMDLQDMLYNSDKAIHPQGGVVLTKCAKNKNNSNSQLKVIHNLNIKKHNCF